MEQENPEIQEDLGTGGKLKNWIQDNIRIIISVLIVVAIAGGIYSYSKRGENIASEEDIIIEEIADEEDGSAITVVGDDEDQGDVDEEAETMANGEDVTMEQDVVVDTDESQDENQSEQEDVKVDTIVSEGVSQETNDAFVETAVKGDSSTTLARKALKSYLEKNQDSSLTAEQKIYIEDYLRKAVSHQGSLRVGDSMSFSKIMIKDGIEKAKILNDAQLNNLKKYSARVSVL